MEEHSDNNPQPTISKTDIPDRRKTRPFGISQVYGEEELGKIVKWRYCQPDEITRYFDSSI